MKLLAQDLNHLLAGFLQGKAPPLLDLADGFCLWQLQSLQQDLPHLFKCILHFCAGRWRIQLLRQFPEALAVLLVRRFDQAKKTYLILNRSLVEATDHHIWLALVDLCIELEEGSNPLPHFSNVKSRIEKPRLAMRSACCAEFSLPRLHQDLPKLVLRCLINCGSKELLPLVLLFVSEGTSWRPPPVGIVGT